MLSDSTPEVEYYRIVHAYMQHNRYLLAVGQIPRSTERISSFPV